MTEKRFEEIYALYVQEWEIQKKIEENISNKMDRGKAKTYIMAQGPGFLEMKNNRQIALELVSINREAASIKDKLNRLTSTVMTAEFTKRITDYYTSGEVYTQLSDVPRPLIKEVYDDIMRLKNIEQKYLTNSEYRRVFNDFYYEGTGRDWIKFKQMYSPDAKMEQEETAEGTLFTFPKSQYLRKKSGELIKL